MDIFTSHRHNYSSLLPTLLPLSLAGRLVQNLPVWHKRYITFFTKWSEQTLPHFLFVVKITLIQSKPAVCPSSSEVKKPFFWIWLRIHCAEAIWAHPHTEPAGNWLSIESIVDFRFEFAKILKFYTFGKIHNVSFRVIFNSFTSRHTVRICKKIYLIPRTVSFHVFDDGTTN
jgi:hypothetical protein